MIILSINFRDNFCNFLISKDTPMNLIKCEYNSRFTRVFLAALLPILWDGIPFALLGLPRAGGYYAISILVAISIFYLILKMPQQIKFFDRTAIYISVGFFVIFLGVSFISGEFFFRNPVNEWIPELVYFSPVFLIFVFMAFDIRANEALFGLIFAATIAAIIVFIDRFFLLDAMEQYRSTSGFDFDARRIMMLKNEIGLALAALIVICFKDFYFKGKFIFVVATLLVAFDLLVVTETRLVIGAVALAFVCACLFLFNRSENRRALIYGSIAILMAMPFVLNKYIDQLHNVGSLAEEDAGVAWRLTTVEHYRQFFDETYGIGFGVMSIREGRSNIVAFSIHDAGVMYGLDANQKWGLFLADTSFYGAMFQFGYVGLLLTIFASFYVATSLISIIKVKNYPWRDATAVVGFVALFLLISPWPTNMFTLNWSILSGNYLLAWAARVKLIVRNG